MSLDTIARRFECTGGSPLSLTVRSRGRVVSVQGTVITARIPSAEIGNFCLIETRRRRIAAQITAFMNELVTLAPFEEINGLSPGCTILNTGVPPRVNLTYASPGAVIDPFGTPLNIVPAPGLRSQDSIPLFRSPPAALERPVISSQLATGIRSLDALCALGRGQRIGLFAPAGGGKSTLLQRLAGGAHADLIVLAMAGERGREVREFISAIEAGPPLITVVATSDRPPLQRMLAAVSATAIAEHYRDQGKDVLLLVDSITRTARAMREVSLASGEIPVRQGYTPSVFSRLPSLIERAGASRSGSITAIYTVLREPHDEGDILAEELRSLLDGHISLDPDLLKRGITPAIDFTRSISRLQTRLLNEGELRAANLITALIAKLNRERDLLLIGGRPDKRLKAALSLEEPLSTFLRQPADEFSNLEQTRIRMLELAARIIESGSLASSP